MSDTVIDLAGVVVNAFVGVGLIWLAISSNKIAKNQNRIASREVYLSVYDKVTEALGHVFVDGAVKDPAKDLFWQARDRARLELPKELEDYTQQLFDDMWEAYILYYNKITGEDRLPKGDERTEVVNRHSDLIEKLIKSKPNEVFEKHMRIKA